MSAGGGLGAGGQRAADPLLSFADGVILLAGSRRELETLAAAYLQWAGLLHLRVLVPKTQVWWCGRTVQVAGEATYRGSRWWLSC